MEQLQPWWMEWLRLTVKYITHKLTGQTEIERVSSAGNLNALQRSIVLSKELAAYKERHRLWKQPYHPDLSKQLCAIKNITNSDAQFRVTHLLQQLHSWKHACQQIQTLSSTKYDSRQQNHQALLMQIWRELRPGRQIAARKSDEWIQLGFQGDDPATDFRGAGVLGLINLNSWVKTAKGKQIFKTASTEGSEYFFASASIYFTMFALQLLKQNKIATRYWVVKAQKVQQLFQRLFEAVFTQFDAFWKTIQDKSIMQFNANLQQFAKLIRNSRIAEINQLLILHQ